MSISLIILTTLILIVMFGAGQRLLDKMRLNDRWALLIMVAIVIGILIPPISIGPNFRFSIGGFLIPLGVCIYLLIRVGWSRDLLRAAIGTVVTAAVIIGLDYLLPSQTPQDIVIANTLLYGAAAGIVAYLLGRSRRNALICAVLGITLATLVQFLISLWGYGVMTTLSFGVAGAFDTIILASLIGVGLAELIGKSTEAVVGKERKAYSFADGAFDYEKSKKAQAEDKKSDSTKVTSKSNSTSNKKASTKKEK